MKRFILPICSVFFLCVLLVSCEQPPKKDGTKAAKTEKANYAAQQSDNPIEAQIARYGKQIELTDKQKESIREMGKGLKANDKVRLNELRKKIKASVLTVGQKQKLQEIRGRKK